MVGSTKSSPVLTSETVSSPRLVVAQQDLVTRQIAPVGFLQRTDEGYVFSYLRRVMDMPGFRSLFGFDDIERRYESPTLFPLFGQRLMNPRRSDYIQYLTVLGLPEGSPPLVVLGRSGGSRAGDSIVLVPEPNVAEDGRTSAVFFIHGMRYKPNAASRVALLREGDVLDLVEDVVNPVNRRALLVTRAGDELGWVPDLLLDYVHHVREVDGMVIRAVRVNGPGVPPNLRVRVKLTGRTPTGYRPFRGEEWSTFA